MNLCRVDFFHVNASFSWFSHIPFGEFFLNFVQLLTMIMGKTYLNFKDETLLNKNFLYLYWFYGFVKSYMLGHHIYY